MSKTGALDNDKFLLALVCLFKVCLQRLLRGMLGMFTSRGACTRFSTQNFTPHTRSLKWKARSSFHKETSHQQHLDPWEIFRVSDQKKMQCSVFFKSVRTLHLFGAGGQTKADVS